MATKSPLIILVKSDMFCNSSRFHNLSLNACDPSRQPNGWECEIHKSNPSSLGVGEDACTHAILTHI